MSSRISYLKRVVFSNLALIALLEIPVQESNSDRKNRTYVSSSGVGDLVELTLGRIFRLMSYCPFCGNENVEEDMEGRFPPDTIIIKCRRCGKKTFITGEQVLEAKRKLGILGNRRKMDYC